MKPREYVEKHHYVQAMQLENTEESAQAMASWCGGLAITFPKRVSVHIPAPSGHLGNYVVRPGYWVIKTGEGFLRCNPDDFVHLYEESFRMPSWVYDHPDVCTNPHRMGGQPCVRGTRVPVDIIFNLMDGPDGATDEEITYFYPHVPADQITRLRTAREEYDNADPT